jgi:hypothetical protein
MSGRPINADRQNAIELGLRTYMGAPHSKCGTTTRYASSGGCVHCARVTAAEQREELKVLKASAVNRVPAEGVDIAEQVGQEDFEQSIEDML